MFETVINGPKSTVAELVYYRTNHKSVVLLCNSKPGRGNIFNDMSSIWAGVVALQSSNTMNLNGSSVVDPCIGKPTFLVCIKDKRYTDCWNRVEIGGIRDLAKWIDNPLDKCVRNLQTTCLVKTLWGRMTHICVSKLIGIGSDNGWHRPGDRPLSEPMLEYR